MPEHARGQGREFWNIRDVPPSQEGRAEGWGREQWDTGSRWNSVQRVPTAWNAANKDTHIWDVKRSCVGKAGGRQLRPRGDF